MRQLIILLVAGWGGIRVALAAGGPGFLGRFRSGKGDKTPPVALLRALLDMGDALQEVSVKNLQARGGWDRDLFRDVLAHVEQLTPVFQAALVEYLAGSAPRQPDVIGALLAVDRLSAAYTYWTRLFPPREGDQAIFVLSLLQDLSAKVEHAIRLVGDVET
ncbi:MAG: hypothetical protein JXQ72_16950 [Anaerolineae bacterium]|nr:hypothetical protein [Anaerolineae bacterium]